MATKTTTTTGSLTASATWGGSLPAAGDDWVVAHACTLSGASITYNSLTITTGTVTVSGNSTMTGNVTSNSTSGILFADSSNLTITGSVTASGANTKGCYLNNNNNVTLNVSGTATGSGSGAIGVHVLYGSGGSVTVGNAVGASGGYGVHSNQSYNAVYITGNASASGANSRGVWHYFLYSNTWTIGGTISATSGGIGFQIRGTYRSATITNAVSSDGTNSIGIYFESMNQTCKYDGIITVTNSGKGIYNDGSTMFTNLQNTSSVATSGTGVYYAYSGGLNTLSGYLAVDGAASYGVDSYYCGQNNGVLFFDDITWTITNSGNKVRLGVTSAITYKDIATYNGVIPCVPRPVDVRSGTTYLTNAAGSVTTGTLPIGTAVTF